MELERTVKVVPFHTFEASRAPTEPHTANGKKGGVDEQLLS